MLKRIKRILSLVLVVAMLSVWTPYTPVADVTGTNVYAEPDEGHAYEWTLNGVPVSDEIQAEYGQYNFKNLLRVDGSSGYVIENEAGVDVTAEDYLPAGTYTAKAYRDGASDLDTNDTIKIIVSAKNVSFMFYPANGVLSFDGNSHEVGVYYYDYVKSEAVYVETTVNGTAAKKHTLTDAGEYEFVLPTELADPSFVIASSDTSLTYVIKPAELDLSGCISDKLSAAYTGSNIDLSGLSVDYDVNAGSAGFAIRFGVSSDSEIVNVGEYDVKVGELQYVKLWNTTDVDAKNYTIINKPETVKLEVYPFALNAANVVFDAEGTYDGKEHTGMFTDVNGNKLPITYTVEDGKTIKNVGTYKLTVTGIDDENLTLPSELINKEYTYTVNKYVITEDNISINWSSCFVQQVENLLPSSVSCINIPGLDDTLKAEMEQFIFDSFVITDENGNEYSSFNDINVQNKYPKYLYYTLKADTFNAEYADGNYELEGDIVHDIELVIKTVDFALTFNEADYTGSDITLPTAYAELRFGGTITATVSCNETVKNVGTYTLTITSDHPYFKASSSTATATFKVKAVAADVKVNGEDSEDLTYVYDGQNKWPEIEASAENGQQELELDVTVTKDGAAYTGTEIKDAGEYVFTIIPKDANYDYDTLKVTVNIVPAPVDVSVEGGNNVEYKGAAYTFNATYTDVNGDEQSAAYTVADDKVVKDAGNYTLNFTIADDNYVVSEQTKSQNVTVTPRSVEAVFNTTYTLYKPEGGHDFAATFDGVGEDPIGIELVVVTTDTDGNEVDPAEAIDAGSYSQTASLPEAYRNNYTLTNTTNEIEVGPIGVYIYAVEKTKTYGQADPELAPEVNPYDSHPVTEEGMQVIEEAIEESGLITIETGEDGDTGATRDVGTYDIIADEEELNKLFGDNIRFMFTGSELTVMPLHVELTPNTASSYYYAPIADLTYEMDVDVYVDLADDFTEEDIRDELGEIFITSATETSDAGAYAIYGDDEQKKELTNYSLNINSDNDGYTIKPLNVTLTVTEGQGKTYNDAEDVIEYSAEITTENSGTEMTPAGVEDALGNIITLVDSDSNVMDVDALPGEYIYRLVGDTAGVGFVALTNYNVTLSATDNYVVSELFVEVAPDAYSVFYGKNDPEYYTYSLTLAEEVENLDAEKIAALVGNDLLVREEGKDVGTYGFSFDPANANITIDVNGVAYVNNTGIILELVEDANVYEIKPLPVTVEALDQGKYYGAKDPEADGKPAYDYFVSWTDDTQLSNSDIMNELGTDLIVREMFGTAEGEKAGTYFFSLNEEVVAAKTNFELTFVEGSYYVINRLLVTVVPVTGQSKIYGESDKDFDEDGMPEYAYDVIFDESHTELTADGENGIKAELTDELLVRNEGEEAGIYYYAFNPELVDFEEAIYHTENFELVLNNDYYTINKLEVTVTPVEGQSKIYGEIDPEHFAYELSWMRDSNHLTEDDLRAELTDDLLDREEGENGGTYAYVFNSDIVDENGGIFETTNMILTLAEDTFAITEVEIADIPAIDARTNVINITLGNVDDIVMNNASELYFRIEGDLATMDGITNGFEGLSEYFASEEGGMYYAVVNAGAVAKEMTIDVNAATFTTIDPNGEAVTWNGYLPAGTKLQFVPLDAAGNSIGESFTMEVVAKAEPALEWTGIASEDNIHLNANTENSLTIKGRPDEVVFVTFSSDEQYTGADGAVVTYTEYYKTYILGADGTYKIDTADLVEFDDDANRKHLTQIASVIYADQLNLDEASVDEKFIYDVEAFGIVESNIVYQNRAATLTITLPEMGKLNSVTIPGGTIGEISPSGTGTQFTVNVTFSGLALITSGSAIDVSYTDLAGNAGTGKGTVTKSSVVTPLTVKVRPVTKQNYVPGDREYDSLLITGTGCISEPIRITVADMDNVLFVTQEEIWTDAEGAYSLSIDLDRLPDGETFDITVEYMDVLGQSASVTVTYDAKCLPAVLTIDPYERMPYLSGFAEENVAVAFELNDSGEIRELEVDRHGRFYLTDVPMLFGGIDSFTLYVTDVAGNRWQYTYIIPEVNRYDEEGNELPFKLENVPVAPVGASFYGVDEESGEAYYHILTPVDIAELDAIEEGEKKLEVPVLLGTNYVIGSFSVERTETGIIVNGAIDNGLLAAEDYEQQNEKLYIFRKTPTAKDVHELEKSIEDGKAEAFQYGEEIAAEADDIIWIMAESEITVLEESIRDFEVYDLENDENYNKFQDMR